MRMTGLQHLSLADLLHTVLQREDELKAVLHELRRRRADNSNITDRRVAELQEGSFDVC